MLNKYEKKLNKRLINILIWGKKNKKKKNSKPELMSNKVSNFVKDGIKQMKKDFKI